MADKKSEKRHKIHMDMVYECHLSTHEVEPIIGVSCSLVKKPKMGYDSTTVSWSPKTDSLLSKNMRITVKFDGSPPWPRDAAVWFQVFAKVESSEGKLVFEKAGSGVLHLANLVPEFRSTGSSSPFAESKHRHSPRSVRHDARKTMMVVEVPLFLQSMRIMKDEPVRKGQLTIRAASLSPKDFKEPSKYDLVPGNMKYIESSMMALVKKNIMVFKPEVHEQLGFGKSFEATSEKIERVHAPLYITAAGVLPGEYYWANLAGETDYDEAVYLSIAQTVLERHRVSQKRFVAMVSDMKRDKTTYKTDVHGKAAVLFGEMTSALATTLYYIADYADLNDDRGSTAFSKQKSHITVESFDDAGEREGDDCEGLARFNARTFMGFRDGKFRHPLLESVQAVANMYVGAGTLGSVTSRNIGEASSTGALRIDSRDDKGAEIGAHMWFTLIPKRHFLELVGRTSPTSKDSIAWGDGSTVRSLKPWQSKLPMLISEGTGLLHPAPLAVDAYHETFEEKIKAAEGDLERRRLSALLGKAGVANARIAYAKYQEIFSGDR